LERRPEQSLPCIPCQPSDGKVRGGAAAVTAGAVLLLAGLGLLWCLWRRNRGAELAVSRSARGQVFISRWALERMVRWAIGQTKGVRCHRVRLTDRDGALVCRVVLRSCADTPVTEALAEVRRAVIRCLQDLAGLGRPRVELRVSSMA